MYQYILQLNELIGTIQVRTETTYKRLPLNSLYSDTSDNGGRSYRVFEWFIVFSGRAVGDFFQARNDIT